MYIFFFYILENITATRDGGYAPAKSYFHLHNDTALCYIVYP